jgi:phage gpG-like protein
MIKGSVEGESKVVGTLNAFPDVLKSGLRNGITRACLRLQTKVKQDKLSGQVLNVRTGRLRRSITQRVEEESGSVVGYVGTKVKYARAHEFGFTGNVTVREHLRKAKSGKESLVKAHSRNVHLPERSFLRSALKDLQPAIRQDIRAGVVEAVKGAK